MQTELDGRVAIVTGAAGAIGRAICRRLAENGARVVVSDVVEGAAQAFAATLPGGADRVMACRIDIADPQSVESGVAAVLRRFGQVDILVNNAGINTQAHRVPIDAFPPSEWDRILRVDLDGTYFMSRAALAPMLARGAGGRVVNIASVVGLAALRLQSSFVAAKAALVHLTRAMALELGPRGVLVNGVAPGSVLSEGTRALFYSPDGSFAGRTAEFMDHVPMRRPGTPEEIAEAVLFLSAPESSYVTGQVLAVDGGWTAGSAF